MKNKRGIGLISLIVIILLILVGGGVTVVLVKNNNTDNTGTYKVENNQGEGEVNNISKIKPENVQLNVENIVENKIVYNKNNVIITITDIVSFSDYYRIVCSVNNNNEHPISIYGVTEKGNGNAVRINNILIDNSLIDGNTFSLNRQYFDIGEEDNCTLLSIEKSDCANLNIESIDKISFGIKITILDDNRTKLEPDTVILN